MTYGSFIRDAPMDHLSLSIALIYLPVARSSTGVTFTFISLLFFPQLLKKGWEEVEVICVFRKGKSPQNVTGERTYQLLSKVPTV